MNKDQESLNSNGADADTTRQTVTLFDVLLIILRRKKLIAFVTLATGFVSVILAIVSILLPPSRSYLPNSFTAEAIIMLKSPSGNSSTGGSASSDLSGLIELTGLKINMEADQSSSLVMSLAEQNTFRDKLAVDLDFYSHYGKTGNAKKIIAVRQIIDRYLKVKYNPDNGLLTLKYTDKDPRFAATATNRAVEILQNRFNDVILDYTAQKMRTIEESIARARINMETAQKTFTKYQQKYDIYDLESSTNSSVALMQNAASQLIDLQLQYKNLKSYRNEGDPQIARLAQQIEYQKEFINALKKGSNDLSALNLTLDKMPDIMADYLILEQELTIQQNIYASLKQQLEMSRIEEITGSKVFSIIEKAEIPFFKSGPARGFICICATLAALLITLFASFAIEYGKILKHDPKYGEKLGELSEAIRWSKPR
jgi:tyrosine-protein kinase Etk/Wzc